MARRTITVIGSVNMDLVVSVRHLPRVGETVGDGQFRVVPGGKGANQAVAAAALGASVRMVGCVGEDAYGRLARENLAARGVNVRSVRTVREPTGIALILVDEHGRNLIAVAPGANQRVATRRRCDIALTQLETPYHRPPARFVILNPAPARPVSLRGVDVVIPNEVEAEQLTGQRDPAKAARVLRRRGARRVIITLGERGVFDGGACRPAFRVRAVDTVGAGDAFVGAFAAAVAEGHSDPVRFAQAAAALACTRPGAQNVPSRKDVEGLLS
ncbi:MAG: bifunctional hydroxymethylpyrimidine kinase/phosphomethylpyrimidine kinase [Phycisphaerae bacterium]|nr:bifunctional hydroxymethylpyrimidine kinase/phosphomethylpyrimidine kinase [Phycisphaerae bacterium]